MALNRFVQICVLSAFFLSTVAVFAAEQPVAAPSNNTAPVDTVTVTEQATPPADQIFDLGSLFTPQPTNRDCTATCPCTATGGKPISCVASTSCSSGASFVECDGAFHYCACNPANLPLCRDPVGFCACFNASPSQFVACLRANCAP